MLAETLWHVGSLTVQLRWYILECLFAAVVIQDLFNVGWMYWIKPVRILSGA